MLLLDVLLLDRCVESLQENFWLFASLRWTVLPFALFCLFGCLLCLLLCVNLLEAKFWLFASNQMMYAWLFVCCASTRLFVVFACLLHVLVIAGKLLVVCVAPDGG